MTDTPVSANPVVSADVAPDVSLPREITLVIRPEKTALNLSALVAALSGRPRTTTRKDSQGVRGVVSAGGELHEYDARFTFEATNDGEGVEVRFELVPHSPRDGDKSAGDFGELLNVVRSALTAPDDSLLMLAGFEFELPLESWSPTVKLPFGLETPGPAMPGRPKITGLEFEFAETVEDVRIFRAFVTVAQPLSTLMVRALVIHQTVLSQDLASELLPLSKSVLKFFATQNET